MKRRQDIAQLTERVYDLVVIGGGITGAGISREAVKRGYSCLLLEKGDFASGTSSKSAKLVHGGFRYLKTAQFRLVREGLHERNYLLKHFSHIVKPIPFIFPFYGGSFIYRMALWLYNFMGKTSHLPRYKFLSLKETNKAFPHIGVPGLKGSFIYYDGVTSDARLCNEVIYNAGRKEGCAALNYCEVESAVEAGGQIHVQCRDHIGQAKVSFKSKYLVNAGGPWMDLISNQILGKPSHIVGPSKGVHIILSRDRFPLHHAIVFSSFAGDGRINYGLPWENNTVVIGTTDTEFPGNPGDVSASPEDIQYILHSLEKFTPGLKISEADILSAYAGLRPLIRNAVSSKDRARDYRIWWSHERVINIFGGKLTSFHSMGKHLMRALGKKFPPPGKKGKHPVEKTPQGPGNQSEAVNKYILERYGPLSPELFSILDEGPEMAQTLHSDFQTLMAELHFFVRFQSCHHLDDLLTRRLSLGYILPKFRDQETVVRKAAEVMQRENGWTDPEKEAEIVRYLESINS